MIHWRIYTIGGVKINTRLLQHKSQRRKIAISFPMRPRRCKLSTTPYFRSRSLWERGVAKMHYSVSTIQITLYCTLPNRCPPKKGSVKWWRWRMAVAVYWASGGICFCVCSVLGADDTSMRDACSIKKKKEMKMVPNTVVTAPKADPISSFCRKSKWYLLLTPSKRKNMRSWILLI